MSNIRTNSTLSQKFALNINGQGSQSLTGPEGEKKKLVTSSFCRAVARHSAPCARPGGAESTDLPVYRVFRRCMFEFYAWVLAEDDDCDDLRM